MEFMVVAGKIASLRGDPVEEAEALQRTLNLADIFIPGGFLVSRLKMGLGYLDIAISSFANVIFKGFALWSDRRLLKNIQLLNQQHALLV